MKRICNPHTGKVEGKGQEDPWAFTGHTFCLLQRQTRWEMRPNHCRGGPCTLARAHIHVVTHMYLPIYTLHTHAYTFYFKTLKRKKKISSCLALSPRWESWEIFQYLILWTGWPLAFTLMLQNLLDGIFVSHNSKGSNHTMVSKKWDTWGQAVNHWPKALCSTRHSTLSLDQWTPSRGQTGSLNLIRGVWERTGEGKGLSTDTVSNVSDRSFLYRWLERRNNLNRFPKLEPLFHFWEIQGFLGFS